MLLIRLLILAVLVVIGATFALNNSDTVTLGYYFGSQEMPLSLLLIITLIVGAVIGMLSATITILKLKRENSSLRRKTKVVTEEVENLRAIPLKD
jgi:putative membrane protein